KPMSVCGEMAGDPAAAVLLLALGCDVLSMSASSLPRVKWLLRQISLDDARALLRDALREDNAYLVQSMLHLSLRNMRLGTVVQPLRRVPRTWSLSGLVRIRSPPALSCTCAGRAGARPSREGPASGCSPTRGLENPARFAQLLPVGAEVPLDEGNAAVGIDGQQAAGTGAVVFPADEGGGQPPFPLQTHTTVRQLFVGVFPAVPEQAQQGVAVTLAVQMLVEPLAQRLQLGPGTVQRGIGQTVEPGRQCLGSSLIAVEVPQLLHVADQQIEARIA